MSFKLNKITLIMISTSFFFVSNPALSAYNSDRFGSTALALMNQNIQSCTPGIDALSRQINFSELDIKGALPFQRTYNTALQLSTDLMYRDDKAIEIDEAAALTYLENRAGIGVGWSHNYDWKLILIADKIILLYLPENNNLPLKFEKQSDGLYGLVNTSTGVVNKDTQYKIIDNKNNIVVEYGDVKVNFNSLSGTRAMIQDFQATQVNYTGGKVLNLSYQPVILNSLSKSFLLSEVADNRGNKIKINRRNMDGADGTNIGKKLQGAISSVETYSNNLNKQNVSYEYILQSVSNNGVVRDLPKLISANSTSEGLIKYNYKDYLHKGMYADGRKSIKGVVIPIISNMTKNNVITLNWEVDDYKIASFTDKSKDYSYLEYVDNFYTDAAGVVVANYRLKLTRPHDSITENKSLPIEEFNISYDGDSVRYYSSNGGNYCLFNNGRRVYEIFVNKKTGNVDEINYKGEQGNIKNTYDNKNRLVKAVEGFDSYTTTFVYDADKTVPSSIIRNDIKVDNVVNDLGQIVKSVKSSLQKDSNAISNTFVYQSNGLLTSTSGMGESDKITYTYDTWGNKSTETQVVNGVNRTTSYIGYNSFGQPERIVYPTGLVEKFVYNVDGTVKSKTTGLGNATSTIVGKKINYTYDTQKRVTSIVNSDGEEVKYLYGVDGRVNKIILPNNANIEKSYSDGIIGLDIEKITDSKGVLYLQQSKRNMYTDYFSIRRGLDLTKNFIQIKNNDQGNVQEIIKPSYYSVGNSKEETMPLRNNIELLYDSMGNVIVIKDSNRKPLYYRYDKNGNLSSFQDAKSYENNSIFEYKNGDQIVGEVNKDYKIKRFYYNGSQDLVGYKFGENKCLYSNIDTLGRINDTKCSLEVGVPNKKLNVDYKFIYDKTRFGRLDSILGLNPETGVDTSFLYDEYDRVIKKTQKNKFVDNFLGGDLSLSYQYTLGDKIKKITLPSGRSVDYVYTKQSTALVLNKIVLDGKEVVNNILYNGGGQLLSWNWGGGPAKYSISYDPQLTGFVSSIKNNDLDNVINFNQIYSYDGDMQISQVKENNYEKNYFYDKDGILIRENNKNNSISIYDMVYTYDNNQNRRSIEVSGSKQPQKSAKYNTDSFNKITQIDGGNIAYTNNSEIVWGPTKPIYNYIGNRQEDRTGDENAPKYVMTYNHDNYRTIRSYQGGGIDVKSNTLQFLYDEEGHLIGEYDAVGNPVTEYIWMGDKPVGAIYGSGTTAKLYWIVSDIKNTPNQLIDSNNGKTIVWKWSPTAFGVNKPEIETVKFNLRFSGQYYDELTGQHYNHNRYYNPLLGRYMEPDPVGVSGGSNPYSYANQNPVMYLDTTGENPVLAAVVGGMVWSGIAYTGGVAYKSASQEGDFIDNIKENWDWGALGTSMVVGGVTGGVTTKVLKSYGLILDRSKFLFPKGSSISQESNTLFGKILKRVPVEKNIVVKSIQPQRMVTDQARVWGNVGGATVKVSGIVASSYANKSYENWSENTRLDMSLNTQLNQNILNNQYNPSILGINKYGADRVLVCYVGPTIVCK